MKTLPRRIPELDGLRAIAVLMVMIEHIYEVAPTNVHPTGAVEFLLTHGWLGVGLFFVLSGFLITGILLDGQKRPDYFKSFYRRRACRILPLAVTCLLVYAALYEVHYDRRFYVDFLLTLSFCANLNVLVGVVPIPGTGPMWSLAVEEHFYLLWPLIIRKFPRHTITCIAITIVLLSPVLRGLAMHYGARPLAIYRLSWFRFDGLALGALLAVFVRNPSFTVRNTWVITCAWLAAIAGVTAILKPYGVLEPKSALGEAMRYTQFQGLFAAVMAITLVHQGSKWTAMLRTRLLGWIASISYCLYLIHMAVGDLYRWALHEVGRTDTVSLPALLLRYAVVFAASFALAELSRRFLEGPFLRIRQPALTLIDRPVA